MRRFARPWILENVAHHHHVAGLADVLDHVRRIVEKLEVSLVEDHEHDAAGQPP